MSGGNSGTAPSEILNPSRITPVQWIILILCMLASMIEGFDIVIIAYTAPAISQDLGVQSSELGVVFSAGVLGMTLGAMMLGGLADRYGRRVVVTGTLLVAGLATSAVMYSSSVTELVILRVIAGMALGALVATLPALTGEFSPGRHRTLIIATLIASANIGGFAGGLIVAELIASVGWKGIFIYTGLLTVGIAILVWLVVPESLAFVMRKKADALETVNRTLTYMGQQPVDRLPPINTHAKTEKASVAALLGPARRATTLLVWIAFFLSFLAVYFVSSWMPPVLTAAGLSQKEAIQATTALPMGAILGNVLIGWLAGRWGLNRLMAAAFALGALCMAALSLMHPILPSLPFVAIWGILCLTGITLLGSFGNMYNVAITVYPAHIRGTGMGWAAGLGRAGAVVSPTLAGVMMAAQLSMPTVFFLFAIPALLAGVCVAFISMRELT